MTSCYKLVPWIDILTFFLALIVIAFHWKKGEIETVYKYLEEKGGVKMLEDPLIEVATREVLAGKKSRSQISNEIRRKERAVAHLKQHYRSQHLSSENIHLCLYSIWYVR